MDEYRLSAQALRDLARIRRYLLREASVKVADKIEDALFKGFEELIRLPWIGHARADIRSGSVRFHTVYRYVIAFQREPQVVIVRVLHGARNLKRLL